MRLTSRGQASRAAPVQPVVAPQEPLARRVAAEAPVLPAAEPRDLAPAVNPAARNWTVQWKPSTT